MCESCGDSDCKLLDKCCGKRKEKLNSIADLIGHRPTERIVERVLVQLADKCSHNCGCGGDNGRIETD